MKYVVRNEIGIRTNRISMHFSWFFLQIVLLLVMPNFFLNEMSDHSKTLQKHFIFIQRHRVSAIADQRN